MFCRPSQRALVSLLLCAGLIQIAAAKEPGSVIESDANFRVTRWTAADGLPQNSIKALIQTRDGYLWLGTLKGLVRFDGMRFTVFDHNNTPEMIYDPINELIEDRKNGLWINAQGSLMHYHDYGFERFGAEHGIREVHGPLYPAAEGGVWFSPRPGQLGRLRQGEVKIWELAAHQNQNALMQIAEHTPTEIYVLFDWDLYSFNLETESLVPLKLPAGVKACYGFLEDPDGSMWLFTNEGLYHGERTNWVRFLNPPGLKQTDPVRIYRTGQDELWVTQPRLETLSTALGRLSDGKIQPFATSALLNNLNVTCFHKDHEGNFWIGTPYCLFRLQPKRLKVYSLQDQLTNDDVIALTHSADGTIWLATADGISAIRDGVVTNISPPEGRHWGKVTVIMADQQNRLWLGWEGNLWRRTLAGAWEQIPVGKQLPGPQFLRAMFQDRQGRVWISTGQGILLQENEGGPWHSLSSKDGLPYPDVRVIYQDRRGDIWFGTYGAGLARLQDGRFTHYQTDLGLHNNRAWWIHEDAEGAFWIGSEDGLNRFQDGRFFTFTAQQGLAENVINNIQEDDAGNLWLSGLRGIYRVARQQLNEVAAGRRAQVDCTAYGEADGMLNSECNGGDNQPAGCKDAQGRIWFPTVQGAVMIDPSHIRLNEVAPPVIIEAVLVAEEVVFGDGKKSKPQPSSHLKRSHFKAGNKPCLELDAASSERVEIRFTATSLVAPDKVRFRYRLQQADRDWHDARDRRSAVYTNLRPGNYRFEVTAANPHGVWNKNPEILEFSIAPHFWQTWTFYGLSATSLIGLTAAMQAYRLRWQRRLLKLEEQRALATERTRIARDLHDDLGTALTGLALELDVIGREPDEGPGLSQRLGKTAQSTRELAERMREVVWTVNPRCDTVSSLADFLEQQVGQFIHMDGVQVRLDFPDDIPSIPLRGEARHQLALAVREALTNVVRHAQATEVLLSLSFAARGLRVTITDNGRGFQTFQTNGDGLQNMRARLEQVGGSFECRSGSGCGTVIILSLPLEGQAL